MSQQNLKTPKLVYNVYEKSGKKIATLVKFANLHYQIQQGHNDSEGPHILYTPHGQLHKQYEIIHYIINQSKEQSKNYIKNPIQAQVQSNSVASDVQTLQTREVQAVKIQEIINLEANDNFITVKMYEKMYQLRMTLFPLLQEFYKYLTGFQKTKKTKYDSLMNKIKKQIGQLDADMNQHPQIFHGESNFLNIVIACQIFMACKFVFQEKFRKSKYSLFNKYQKISHRRQFIEVHGKSDLCQKQYVPSQFEQDLPNNQKQSAIPTDIIKMSNNILNNPPDSNRNQLLYNYFKMTFSHLQSKKQYYPYFWLMFDDLNCQLIEIVQNIQDSSQDNGVLKLKFLHKKIMDQLDTEIDYGILGLYQSQADKKFIIRGLVCLGSKFVEQFDSNIRKGEQIDIITHKIDTKNQKQKKQVQKLWEHVIQNTTQEQIHLNSILSL